MSDNVVFEDYSVTVKQAIKDKALSFLHEVGGELRSQTQRNSRRDTSQTAGSYQYKVDESNLSVHIGSNYQNAIWEEFGTGVFASETGHQGRKGWWVYVKVANPGIQNTQPTHGKSYASPKQAEMAVALLRSKGLDAHMTKGKHANRPLWKAFESSKEKIKKMAEQIFGELK